MNGGPPDWIDARAVLIEGGQAFGWPALAGMAAEWPARWRDGGGAAVGPGAGVAAIAAALVAAEREKVPLLLRRHASNRPESIDFPKEFSVVLETSGTTGAAKRARHDFARLRGRLRGTGEAGARWLLTYEPAAFAGLQVLLTAFGAGAALIAAPGEGIGGLARAALDHGATHVSGTPSFWRAFLMVPGIAGLPLRSVTLGGEAVDQPLLDRLRQSFPQARLRHIYASTEAGALFAVGDGRAGFPAAWLESAAAGEGVGLRVRDGVLQVRSPRAMLDYSGPAPDAGDGWLDTGDRVEVAGDRVLFAGRTDGRINVGGVKVDPEDAERRLLAAPGVADALVSAVRNPITGHILTARLVALPGADPDAVRAAARAALEGLEPAARPRVLTLVERLELAPSGKKPRGGCP